MLQISGKHMDFVAFKSCIKDRISQKMDDNKSPKQQGRIRLNEALNPEFVTVLSVKNLITIAGAMVVKVANDGLSSNAEVPFNLRTSIPYSIICK